MFNAFRLSTRYAGLCLSVDTHSHRRSRTGAPYWNSHTGRCSNPGRNRHSTERKSVKMGGSQSNQQPPSTGLNTSGSAGGPPAKVGNNNEGDVVIIPVDASKHAEAAFLCECLAKDGAGSSPWPVTRCRACSSLGPRTLESPCLGDC